MNYLIQFQINLFSLIVLIILFFIIRTRSTIPDFRISIIQYTIILTALGTILEPLTWIFSNKFFFGAYFLEYSSNFLLVLLAPMISTLLLLYVDYYIFHDRKILKKRLYYLHPAIFTLIMLLVNFISPIYFSINPITNGYHRGNLLVIHYIMTGMIYIFMVLRLFFYRKRISQRVMLVFSIFFGMPILGMILQIFYSRFYFSWTSISLSIMVIYISLETLNGEKDYLSGLYNRHSYDKFIKELIEKEAIVKIVMFDLNDFKAINDNFGHNTGDIIISEFGKILRKVFYDSKMIARVGGDEYIVIIDKNCILEDFVEELYLNLQNSSLELMNNLSFSYGDYTNSIGDSFDDIYITVDKRMYEFKKKGISLRRRNSD